MAEGPKFDQMAFYKHEDILKIDYRPPRADWMDVHADLRPGTWIYSGKQKHLEYLDLPNPRAWNPADDDWLLPDNWKEIILGGIKERLDKYRSFKIFMDICVRCGACADKCHFYIGGGDPKNMPVLRAELLRSIYRNDFTTAGKIMGRFAGGRGHRSRERQGGRGSPSGCDPTPPWRLSASLARISRRRG